MLLRELGERGLIARISQRYPGAAPTVVKGIGDDAAVLATPGEGRLLLATTDMLVEGVHFRREWSAAADIGYKAIAVNISDIAAMGGLPETAMVSLALPGELPVAWVDELYAGMEGCAAEFGVSIVGGDTVGSPPGDIVISISLLGWVEKDRCLYRHRARPGQLIMVTGSLGGSAGGLALLQNPGLVVAARESLLACYQRPRPRVEAGRVLASLPGVGAVQDISDGLAVTACQVAEASGTGVEIYAASLPVTEGLAELGQLLYQAPEEFALYGGEDFELFFTIAPGYLPLARERLTVVGVTAQPVGTVLPPGEGCWLGRGNGREVLSPRGYLHF